MSSNNPSNYQDLTPAFITRTKTKKKEMKAGNFETIKKPVSTNSNKEPVTISKKDANDYEDIGSIPRPTLELKQAIQDARKALKLKQSELDMKCNFSANTTQNYESGKAKFIISDILKMEKVLGVKLPRPPKPSKKPDTDK